MFRSPLMHAFLVTLICCLLFLPLVLIGLPLISPETAYAQPAGPTTAPKANPSAISSNQQSQPSPQVTTSRPFSASTKTVVPTVKAQPVLQATAAPKAPTTTGTDWAKAYPEKVRQWASLLEKYGWETGLDPRLLAAVVYYESGGNPKAYSKSGAVGLMQVMPKDGLAASFGVFENRPTMEQLYDPEFNIKYGSNMLAGLIKKYGSVREGLKSYGPINYGYRYADFVLNIYNSRK